MMVVDEVLIFCFDPHALNERAMAYQDYEAQA